MYVQECQELSWDVPRVPYSSVKIIVGSNCCPTPSHSPCLSHWRYALPNAGHPMNTELPPNIVYSHEYRTFEQDTPGQDVEVMDI